MCTHTHTEREIGTQAHPSGRSTSFRSFPTNILLVSRVTSTGARATRVSQARTLSEMTVIRTRHHNGNYEARLKGIQDSAVASCSLQAELSARSAYRHKETNTLRTLLTRGRWHRKSSSFFLFLARLPRADRVREGTCCLELALCAPPSPTLAASTSSSRAGVYIDPPCFRPSPPPHPLT